MSQRAIERHLSLTRESVDLSSRTICLSFSSESPVLDRTDTGSAIHILDHAPESVRLERLRASGPVLLEHDVNRQIGVVESADIASDRMGRARVRLNDSEASERQLKDAKSGVRANVSVRFQIYNKEKVAVKDGVEVYRVNDWEPLEISFVSIPADIKPGIGRSYAVGAVMPEETVKPEVDVQVIESQSRAQERERIRSIMQLGDKFGQSHLAGQFVDNGKSVDEFNRALLDVMDIKTPSLPIDKPDTQLGMSAKEVKEYNLSRGIQALIEGNPEQAGFEFEVSQEVARARGKAATSQSLHIPFEIQYMAQVMRSDGQFIKHPEKGGLLAPSDFHLEKFIELLREDDALSQLNVTTLAGLQHSIDIPKQSVAANGHWLGEAEPSGLTDIEFECIKLSPKTYSTGMLYTRQMRLQAGQGYMDFLLKRELATVATLARSKAVLFGAGPAHNQPSGLLTDPAILRNKLTFAGEKPTYDDVVKMEAQVDSANALMGSLGYLGNAQMSSLLKRSEISAHTAQFLLNSGQLNGYKFIKSNQMPDNVLLFGNFPDVLLGIWATMEIKADTASRANRDDTILRVWLDIDTAIRHSESFCLLEKGTPIKQEIEREQELQTTRKKRTRKQLRDAVLEDLGEEGLPGGASHEEG